MLDATTSAAAQALAQREQATPYMVFLAAHVAWLHRLSGQRDWVIASIEKNRGGQDNVDLEYEKLFEYSCFDPTGRITAEKLIEERLYND